MNPSRVVVLSQDRMKLTIRTGALVALAVVLSACKREGAENPRASSGAVRSENTNRPGAEADNLCEGLATGKVLAVDKKFNFIVLEPSSVTEAGANKPARLITEFTQETKFLAGGKPAALDD